MKTAVQLLVACLVLAAGATAQPGKERFSGYVAGRWTPAAVNAQYSMYRFRIALNATATESSDANGGGPGLTTIVSSGFILGQPANIKVGTFDQEITIMAPSQVMGAPLSFVTKVVLEFGPQLDDSLVILGGFEQNMANLPVDHDMPVVGGTGQFLGATGFTELHNQREATLTVWVPRLPRF